VSLDWHLILCGDSVTHREFFRLKNFFRSLSFPCFCYARLAFTYFLNEGFPFSHKRKRMVLFPLHVHLGSSSGHEAPARLLPITRPTCAPCFLSGSFLPVFFFFPGRGIAALAISRSAPKKGSVRKASKLFKSLGQHGPCSPHFFPPSQSSFLHSFCF